MKTKYVWITKYAFTTGIIKLRVREIKNNTAWCHQSTALNGFAGYRGKEWHRSLAEAKAHAEVMRKNKLKSLGAQIDRTRHMEFKEVTEKALEPGKGNRWI